MRKAIAGPAHVIRIAAARRSQKHAVGAYAAPLKLDGRRSRSGRAESVDANESIRGIPSDFLSDSNSNSNSNSNSDSNSDSNSNSNSDCIAIQCTHDRADLIVAGRTHLKRESTEHGGQKQGEIKTIGNRNHEAKRRVRKRFRRSQRVLHPALESRRRPLRL